MTSRPYAEVIGDPIGHSKSPLIHNFWLAKLGIDADYRAARVSPGSLAQYIQDHRGDPNWLGCNVTMPLKLDALRAADEGEPEAMSVGAANLLRLQSGRIVAGNTDVAGILSALPPSLMAAGTEVCVMGSGGAARAALAAMRSRDVALALLSVRNMEQGLALRKRFGFGGCVRPLSEEHNYVTAGVIINATPLGMRGKPGVPAEVLDALGKGRPHAVLLDMVYDPVETDLIRAARSAGLRTVDGLEMLVGQAAAAFETFFGQAAPREHDAELRALLTK